MSAHYPTAARDVTPGSSWAFVDHRSIAQLSPPVRQHVERGVIAAQLIAADPTMPELLRRLADRVLTRWTPPVLPPCDTEF